MTTTTVSYGGTTFLVTVLTGQAHERDGAFTLPPSPGQIFAVRRTEVTSGISPLYGFGASESEAIVDWFRLYRARYGVLPEDCTELRERDGSRTYGRAAEGRTRDSNELPS